MVEQRSDSYFWWLIGTPIVEHFGRNLTGERFCGDHFSPSSFVDAVIASFDAAFEQELMIIHTRLHRYESLKSYHVLDQARARCAAGTRSVR